MTEDAHRKVLDELTKQFAAEGKLIEAGWIALRRVWLAPDTPQPQINALRIAFMAGAQHLFHSIMAIMEEGEEPTDRDIKYMDLINAELTAFYDEMQRKWPNRAKR